MHRTELHFHLLPDVDDGPEDDAAAIALARLAVADGTGHVVVTPHGSCIRPEEVAPRVVALRAVLAEADVPLEVTAGTELLPRDIARLRSDELDLVAQGPAGRRWVLVEAPLDGGPESEVTEALERLAAEGLGVLIAHPERSPQWWTGSGALDAMVAAGARLQVNASSLTGFHGENARTRGLALVADGAADVLASDAHGVSRPPRLSEALALLDAAAVPLADAAPAALLRDGIPPLRLGRAAA